MKRVAMALLVGALAAVPAAGFAAPATNAQTTAAKRPAKATAARHATTGVVKSIDEKTLVITRPGKKGREMTFALNPSTQREGTVAVGSTVSVRYQEEGKTHVASALMVRPAKPTARKS
jgi:transcription elongation GreA/GreB family factor